MRRLYRACAFLILLLFAACQSKEGNEQVAWPNGVKYEVFVLSFADGNGDGKGDFKGLTSKLDYLQDLGVNGLWLMPIMNSPSYHKYDVMDYKSVNPEYGTVDEFKKFVDEAHSRNIKVIIDLVLNHTDANHPWFQSAIKGKDSPYRDYYVWAKKDSIRAQISKKTTSFDSDNITQWHAVNGDTLAEHYYGFFWKGMPDLNFDNPKVRNEFKAIGKFWLHDVNVDGFRLDAARHIYPLDREADSHAFWIEFRKEMQQIKPDVYLVGEVWAPAKDVAPYLKGLPSLFNFDMGNTITQVVNAGRDTINLIQQYKAINDYYKTVTSDYLDATFLRNHDQNRILSDLGGNVQKAKIAAGILLTLPGTPYLYYGEEIGMLGSKPDEFIREPFVWDADKKDAVQTSWEVPKYSSASTIDPLSKQKDDSKSIYQFYRNLIHHRNASKALTFGEIENSNLNITEVVSFIRTYEAEELLVLNNISDVEVTVKLLDGHVKFDAIDYASDGAAKLQDGALVLPAYSTVILK